MLLNSFTKRAHIDLVYKKKNNTNFNRSGKRNFPYINI